PVDRSGPRHRAQRSGRPGESLHWRPAASRDDQPSGAVMHYGYVGLGHLGGQLAASLLRAGFPLTVHDRNRAAADPLIAKGAAWADSPKALAAHCDAVITCLPSPAVSEAVLTGADGILAGLAKVGA